MAVLTDKKTKRLYIQFDLHGRTYKKRLPAGTSKQDADHLELKWKHDLFFDGQMPRRSPSFKEFAEDVYLPYVEANQTPESLKNAIYILRIACRVFGD